MKKRNSTLHFVVSLFVVLFGILMAWSGLMMAVGSPFGSAPSLFEPHVVGYWFAGLITVWSGFALARSKEYGWSLSIACAFFWPAYGFYMANVRGDSWRFTVGMYWVPWPIALFLLWRVRMEIVDS